MRFPHRPCGNLISEWAVIFRYENFFIPRVEKSSKISPWEKNLASRGPTALGRTRFFALVLIFEDFSTLGMKKFPYLKTGPFGNPIFFTQNLEFPTIVTYGYKFFRCLILTYSSYALCTVRSVGSLLREHIS